jgi:hypothetical protein
MSVIDLVQRGSVAESLRRFTKLLLLLAVAVEAVDEWTPYPLQILEKPAGQVTTGANGMP